MTQLVHIATDNAEERSIESEAVKPALSRLQLVPTRLRMALLGADIVALLSAVVLAYVVTGWVQQYIFHMPTSVIHQVMLARVELYLMLAVGVLIAMGNKGLYSARLPWWSNVQTIGKIILVAFLIGGFLNFAMKIESSRLLIATNWGFAFFLIIAGRYAVYSTMARTGRWKVPAVIMADNDVATDTMVAFHNEPCSHYHVHTVFLRDAKWKDFDRAALPTEFQDVLLRVGMDDCSTYVQNNPDNFYIISMDAFRGETRDKLIQTLNEVKAHYALLPSLSLSGIHGTMPHYYFGHDVMMIPAEVIGRKRFSLGRVFKRIMDVGISAIALLLLAPLFAFVGAMLKIEGQGGSVFYGGKRVGKNDRLFKCWKFRSMEPDSDHLLQAYLDSDPMIKAHWDKYRKLEKDPRITTRTASMIRKLSIDELPQLWNVLVGDMSLVGPRPILSDEKHYFGRRLSHYLSVRPGLTGLWQVSGRNNASFMRRVYWDSWYVRNWSLWHDIIIMIKTPMVLLSRKGAH